MKILIPLAFCVCLLKLSTAIADPKGMAAKNAKEAAQRDDDFRRAFGRATPNPATPALEANEELGIFTASYVLEKGSVGPFMGRGRIYLEGAGFNFGMVDNAQIQFVAVRVGIWRGGGETLPAYRLKAFAKIGKNAVWENVK